ncbi:MAG TPA: ATP-binding protein [Roseiflexaceae bacterium]|nr:ATP-binding protein [Roseiflexaceae bacterium]
MRLRRPLTLRARLALGYSLFFTLVLAFLSIGVYLAVRAALMRQINEQLVISADLIQQDFEASNVGLSDYFEDPAFLLRTHPPRVEGLESPALYVQVITTEGSVAVTSASLHGQRLPLDPQERTAVLAGATYHSEIALGAGRVLMMARPLLNSRQTVGVLLVAHPLREIGQTLNLLLVSLLGIGLVALLAALRGGAWLAQGALAPVGVIAQTARQIVHADHLGQRIQEQPADDEIGRLTVTINEMLERLEQLFLTQRRIVADVSHELRTPLTAMRGNLDLMRRGALHDPRALHAALADMERELGRLTRLTSDLLVLAQAEAGARLVFAPLALDDLVLEVVRELRPLAQQVALLPDLAEQVALKGDRDRLKQALLNLVANALAHTPPGGVVRVGLARTPEAALLRVSDTGVGIAPADLPHLFERFYRADKARSGDGAGLGLAIVKWVAEAHAGSVAVESAPGQGSVFTLYLPLNPNSHSQKGLTTEDSSTNLESVF